MLLAVFENWHFDTFLKGKVSYHFFIMLPSALARRETELLNVLELPESGTLPMESELFQKIMDGVPVQSAAQSTNTLTPLTNYFSNSDMATAMLTSSSSGVSQPDGSSYHAEKSTCCFCRAQFTKLQQHMPNHHPYVFSDLMAADKPSEPDLSICLPFMKRGARAHMIPYIVAMRYQHPRYAEDIPDWVREAISVIVEASDAPERIDLMSQLESSDAEEKAPPKKKKEKGKGKKKEKPVNEQVVAANLKAKDDALLAFAETIPVTNGSSSKGSAKASTSKKRKVDDSSPESDQEKPKSKKKRSRGTSTAPAQEDEGESGRAVVEFMEDVEDPPSASNIAAHMLTGHISSLGIPMRHAKGDGIKLAGYIASNVTFDILKAAVAMLDDYCNEGKFEVRASGDIHYVWKGMFKKPIVE